MAVDHFNYYNYIDDNGDNYTILLQASSALILGISPISPDTYPPWPKKHKDLRHITGRDSAGTVRRRLTITNMTNALYANDTGVSWTDKEGNTIIREGRFGQKFPRKG
jgi:hypothetical protein